METRRAKLIAVPSVPHGAVETDFKKCTRKKRPLGAPALRQRALVGSLGPMLHSAN